MAIDWSRRNYTPEQFRTAWLSSSSIKDVLPKLGYPYSGGYYRLVHEVAVELDLSKEDFLDTIKSTTSGLLRGEYRVLSRISAHDCPIAYSNGQILEHRYVAYQKYGDGPHTCHWCGTCIVWKTSKNCSIIAVVDHLNNKKLDNNPDNLVLSCSKCNTERGTVDRWLAQGYYSHFISITN